MSYTINISLPKELAQLAQKEVKRGYYESVSELIRDALRRLLVRDVPTFQMSKKAEKRAMKAYQEYLDGKAKPIKSIDELLD